jgi:diguanylate cyclase (GGDEF)-like protein
MIPVINIQQIVLLQKYLNTCGADQLRKPNTIALLAGLTAITAIAMAYLLIYLINGISTGANAIDETKTRQSVQSLVSGLFEHSAGLLTDNAKLDDAAANAYGDVNPQWMFDNWGSTTADQNYDVAMVIDENGKALAKFSDGAVLQNEPKDFFGLGYEELLQTLPKDNFTFATSLGFIETKKGIAILSAAPILPYNNKKKIPTAAPRLLVFTKTLTPEYVSSLGKRLALQNFAMDSIMPVSGVFVPLQSNNGKPIAYFKWTPDRPGDKAKSDIQAPAIAAITAMIACMLMLTFVSWRLSVGLQKSEQRAWMTANTDALTSLPNRFAVNNSLKENIRDLKLGRSKELAIIVADLDGFKDVNDSYGHQIGDLLLQGVTSGLTLIASHFNASLSRLGGDEFAVVAVGEGASQRCKDFAEATFKFLSEPLDIQGRVARVGMSMGIAVISDEIVSETEFLRRADVAMYMAKEQGKNRYRFYEPELDAARRNRSEMAERLRNALATRAIQVAYQPIVDVTSHQITGVEALARWQGPDGQWTPPDQFISIAEEFGLIDALSNQVLSIACRDAASWNDITLSVNVSPVQFRNPKFVDDLIAIVDQSGLRRNRLELEVTEGYIIEHGEIAKSIIDKLHSLGLQVSLDDFGTGYSSIGYLRKFNFDKLKIDRSIVKGMLDDASARSIILATVSLATSLNMTVTAEGVETEEEAKLLRLAGCCTLQGYHFGRPQLAQSIERLLENQPLKQAVA